MRLTHGGMRYCCVLAWVLCAAAESRGQDWPTYRGDAARSAVTAEELKFPLAPAWTYQSAQVPRPAWPVPGKEPHRIDFDYGPVPVVAGGMVYFGSSADDTVRALDERTGALKWRFTTGGPIRFAPAIDEGRAYVASDDGTLYCLDAESGKVVWKFHGSGKADLILGNGRLISRWPLRSGVLVDQGVVYFTAGMWPAEGVYVYALRATTGEVIWCNDMHASSFMAHALVLGQPDVRLAEALAGQTDLHVISVLRDAATAESERKRLLEETTLYGTRLAVVTVEQDAALPLPPYFANLVVASAESGFSPRQIYNALRPCGGLMCFPGMNRQAVIDWAKKSGASKKEVRPNGESLTLVRGKLPAPFDWDSEQTSDQRVSWPLELLWFGGPGPARTADRKSGAPTPIPANGRYFVTGENHVIAVDAYNGTELWAQPLPEANSRTRQNLQGLSADDDFVFLNFGNVSYQLDARTGEQVQIYGSFEKSKRFSLDKPERFEIDVDKTHSGVLTLESSPEGLEIELETKDPKVTQGDAWELYFDFRPAGNRRNLYETGAFQMIVESQTGTCRAGAGPSHPETEATFEPSEQGTRVVLRIGWDAIEKMIGRKPNDFGFAATLVSDDDEKRGTVERTNLFGDDLAVIRNNGWATFERQPVSGEAPAIVRPLSDLPERARGWARRPQRSEEDADTFRAYRTHPLLGKTTKKSYSRAYGCSHPISSATMEFFRSGTIGFYDFHDDSGVRNFGGVRSACDPGSLLPALGLLIANEGASGCSCSYNFQTSLALVPTQTRRNEDWAVFQDTGIREGDLMRYAALNLGAPGDRRDSEWILWQGFPRPVDQIRKKQLALAAPLHLETLDGFGRYRVNADRTSIKGTDRPWIYASGYRGLKSATWDIRFYDADSDRVASEVDKAPAIDGVLDDGCWDGSLSIPLPDRRAQAWLRYDKENLYVAYEQKAVVDRRGRATPIKSSTRGQDAPVWDDDAIELRIGGGGSRILHIGVAASGARYDGRWWPAPGIPRLEQVRIDGVAKDWGDDGLKVEVAPNADIRLGWNDKGLLYLVRLDKRFVVSRSHTGLLLLMVKPDSEEFVQLGIRPKDEEQVFSSHLGEGKTARPAEISDTKSEDSYLVEARFPWENLEVVPEPDGQVSLGILGYADEIDATFKTFKSDPRERLMRDHTSLLQVKLAETASAPLSLKHYWAAEGVVRAGVIDSITEDEAWGGPWKSAVKLAAESFSAELAIPWKTLEAEGMDRSRLKVAVEAKGQVKGEPDSVWRSFDSSSKAIALRQMKPGRGPYTVRLHFADPDNDQPGRRVFDVKLQGDVVLEDFDIVKTTGGKNTAVIKEFEGIQAARTIRVELVPKGQNRTEESVPVLSGIEIVVEEAHEER